MRKPTVFPYCSTHGWDASRISRKTFHKLFRCDLPSLFRVSVVTLFVGACAVPEPINDGSVPEASSSTLHLLAQILAISLEATPLRQELFEELVAQASSQQGVNLSRYVNRSTGLRRALRAELSRTDDRDLTIDLALEQIGAYELQLVSILDQLKWSIGEDAVIVPLHSDLRQEADTIVWGYRIGGDSVAVPLLATIPEAVVTLAPAVLSREEPNQMTNPNIDEPLTIISPSRLDPPPAAGLNLAGRLPWSVRYDSLQNSLEDCWSIAADSDTVDADRDGIRDYCEYDIAHMFRPVLNVAKKDSAINSRETYWAVRRGNARTLYVFYALAYHRDVGLNGHAGDSEFILIKVHNIRSRYLIADSVTMSAHFGTLGNRSERGRVFEWRDDNSRPVIWVANGKHANYKSMIACEEPLSINVPTDMLSKVFTGILSKITADDCSGERQEVDLKVLQFRNLGGHGLPLVNCVWSRMYDYQYPECFWGMDDRFRGWLKYREPGSATAYGRLLCLAGFFATPGGVEPRWEELCKTLSEKLP